MNSNTQKDVIDIIFVGDCSQSTQNNDLIGKIRKNYNSYINEQKSIADNSRFTFISFNSIIKALYLKTPVKYVQELTEKEFYAHGMTALWDAIGRAIEIGGDSKNVQVTIMTDGEENYSREYNQDKVLKLIAEKQKIGWEFNFFGTNLNELEQGRSIGIPVNSVIEYEKSTLGVQDAFGKIASKSFAYRSSRSIK